MLNSRSFSLLRSLFFLAVASTYVTVGTTRKRHLLAKRAVGIAVAYHLGRARPPKISVILPAYNVAGHGKFERAVQSILEQPFIDFELVLVMTGHKTLRSP